MSNEPTGGTIPCPHCKKPVQIGRLKPGDTVRCGCGSITQVPYQPIALTGYAMLAIVAAGVLAVLWFFCGGGKDPAL
ncbi:MAG: hypothetical protein ABGY75_14610, partial [Gemmataceae bacterium]